MSAVYPKQRQMYLPPRSSHQQQRPNRQQESGYNQESPPAMFTTNQSANGFIGNGNGQPYHYQQNGAGGGLKRTHVQPYERNPRTNGGPSYNAQPPSYNAQPPPPTDHYNRRGDPARPPPNNYTLQKVDNYFSFLEDDQQSIPPQSHPPNPPHHPTNGGRPISNGAQIMGRGGDNGPGDYHLLKYSPPPAPRDSSNKRSGDGSRMHQICGILFTLAMFLIGAALASYGGWRTSVLAPKLLSLRNLSRPVTEGSETASSCMETGLWMILNGLLGTVAFGTRMRGLKAAHLVVNAVVATLAIFTVMYVSREVADQYRVSVLDREELTIDISLISLIGAGTLVVVMTTSIQSAHSLIPLHRRHHTFPAALLLATVLAAVGSSVLVSLGGVALKQTLQFTPAGYRLWVYYLKRDMVTISIVVGFYSLAISFLALGAAFTRSRPVAIAVLTLYVPAVFVLTKLVLHGNAILIPAVYSKSYVPKDNKTIFYVLFGISGLTNIFEFLVMIFAGLSIFRR